MSDTEIWAGVASVWAVVATMSWFAAVDRGAKLAEMALFADRARAMQRKDYDRFQEAAMREIRTRDQRIAELEAALKPFAEAIYYFDHDGNFAVQKEHIKNSDYLRAKKAFLDAK